MNKLASMVTPLIICLGDQYISFQENVVAWTVVAQVQRSEAVSSGNSVRVCISDTHCLSNALFIFRVLIKAVSELIKRYF